MHAIFYFFSYFSRLKCSARLPAQVLHQIGVVDPFIFPDGPEVVLELEPRGVYGGHVVKVQAAAADVPPSDGPVHIVERQFPPAEIPEALPLKGEFNHAFLLDDLAHPLFLGGFIRNLGMGGPAFDDSRQAGSFPDPVDVFIDLGIGGLPSPR